MSNKLAMNEKNEEIDLSQIVQLILSKKKEIVKFGLIGFVVGLVIAISIPKEYVASVKMAIESTQKGGANGSMGALASMMGYSGQDVEGISEKVYPEIIKSSPFLMEFAQMKVEGGKDLVQYLKEDIKKPWWSYVFGVPSALIGWVKGGDDKERKSDFIDSPEQQFGFWKALSARLEATSDSKTGLYTLTARFQNPKIAYLVADTLYEKLGQYVINYKTQKTRYNLNTSEKAFGDARQKFYAADAAYAVAVDQNQNLISKSAGLKVERLKNERDLAFQIYQQLAAQVESDRIKLNEETPIATIIEPARLPLQADSPSKMLYIIAFTILFPLAYVGTVVVKYSLNR